jgi:hypothetical protein
MSSPFGRLPGSPAPARFCIWAAERLGGRNASVRRFCPLSGRIRKVVQPCEEIDHGANPVLGLVLLRVDTEMSDFVSDLEEPLD